MPECDASPVEVDVEVVADAGDLPVGADFVGWVTTALSTAHGGPQFQAGVVGVRIVGAAEGSELNSTWRSKEGPTNVLAFPGPAGLPEGMPREYGDLVICLPVVEREAAEQGKPAVNHLAHLVVHGTLHLLGHTHDEEDDAARMEALETRILAGLGIPDPYLVK